jgi:hypothetical protein
VPFVAITGAGATVLSKSNDGSTDGVARWVCITEVHVMIETVAAPSVGNGSRKKTLSWSFKPPPFGGMAQNAPKFFPAATSPW